MNRIQIGGYTRITKKEAARRYNAGEVIRLTACKLSPVSPWGCHSDAQRESYTQVGGDGFNTTTAPMRRADTRHTGRKKHKRSPAAVRGILI